MPQILAGFGFKTAVLWRGVPGEINRNRFIWGLSSAAASSPCIPLQRLATRSSAAGPEFETPGAQELGPHTFQFAITTYRGGYLGAELMSRIATYNYPPRVFTTREAAPPVASMQLFSCNKSRVMFSTARPMDRRNAYVARAFSISPNPETALFGFGDGRVGRVVDLAVRPLQHSEVRRKRGGHLEVNLHPFEIVTFRVTSKKISSNGHKNIDREKICATFGFRTVRAEIY